MHKQAISQTNAIIRTDSEAEKQTILQLETGYITVEMIIGNSGRCADFSLYLITCSLDGENPHLMQIFVGVGVIRGSSHKI
ncbi:hypothetical protein RRG08_046838 [Elysia crispata]|uniref:Uncharacterized protein n=1 Tax=Elysia crispata TaxID=231223 RepID=A0AAE0ZMN5_9GAST|nr:hypothetical protein RRG08_046838 [Elysia crispata]